VGGRGLRAVSALVGFAAILVLAVALLTVTSGHPAQPAASVGGPQVRVDWTAVKPPNQNLYLGSAIAEFDGKLVASLENYNHDAGNPETSASLWSYDAGTSVWTQMAAPRVFLAAATDALANIWGLTSDGRGGLFAYGYVQVSDAAIGPVPEAMVWHTVDGKSWSASRLGVGEVYSLFVHTDGAIAIGDFGNPTGCPSDSAAGAWTSADFKTWTRRSVAEPAFLYRGAFEWKGRFVVLSGSDPCMYMPPQFADTRTAVPAGSIPLEYRFWTSSDGASWQRTAVTGFPATDGTYGTVAMTVEGQTFLAYQLTQDSQGQPSLISSDLANWRLGVLPEEPAGRRLTGVVAAAGTFLAVDTAGEMWSSADAENWRLLPDSSQIGACVAAVPGATFDGSYPVVAGDLIAVPGLVFPDGSDGFALGRVAVDANAPTLAP
jgi:hypothetical protein